MKISVNLKTNSRVSHYRSTMNDEQPIGFKSIYYDNKLNKIYLKETDSDKYDEYEFQHTYYVRDETNTSPIKNINGKSFIKRVASSKKNLEDLKGTISLCESDLDERVKFLHERYSNVKLVPDPKQFRTCFIDIEIAAEAEFPKPTEAKYPINLISVKDSKTGKTITFGTEQYTGNSPLVQSYHYFASELEMMKIFIKWFRKNKYDFITGWNVQNFDMTYIINRTILLCESDIELHDFYLNLSPLKKIRQKKLLHPVTKKHIGHYYDIAGIATLDYMDLYKNFTFVNLESYTLQFVCQHEIKKGKTELDGAINQIYKTDWNTFVEYNINDVDLVWELDAKKKFLELAIIFCYDSLTPFDKVFSSISTIEGYILKFMHKRNLVMPDRKNIARDWWHDENMYIVKDKLDLPYYQNCKEDKKTFEPFYVKGGYVEAKPGLYKKVMSGDVISSYPHQIMQYNISVETKVIKPSQSEIDSGNLIKSEINGVYYKRTDNAILPIIVKQIFDERKHFKKLKAEAEKDGNKELATYYDSQQHIRKILINSMYGVLANKFFHFYDVDNARAITRGGRVTVRYIGEYVNLFFANEWHKGAYKKILGEDYVPDVNGQPQILKQQVKVLTDTDSNFFCLEEIYQKYCPTMGEVEFFEKMDNFIFPFIDRILQIKADNNKMKQIISFNREGYMRTHFVLAKKKYVKQLIKNEDDVYDPPMIKIVGIEIKKSDTPTFAKKHLMDIIKDIIDVTDKDKNFKILTTMKKIYSSQTIDDISQKSSVQEYSKYVPNKIDWYIKNGLQYHDGMTMNSKSALSYNYIIEKLKIPLMPIGDGSKIKYVRVLPSNPYGIDVIAYVGNWPLEFDKIFKVDYDLQFEKTVLSVVERFWVVLGWCTLKTGIKLRESKLGQFIKKR